MGSKGKKRENAVVDAFDEPSISPAHEAELIYMQGLYSGFIGEQEEAKGIFAGHRLSLYAAIVLGAWVTFYAVLALGLAPALSRPLMGFAFAITILVLFAAFSFLRGQPILGVWPANRTAAIILLLMPLNFWVWVSSVPFVGTASYIYLALDFAGFSAILTGVYLFAFKRWHIETLVKILFAKAFIDFAAYILSGGFGIALLNSAGFNHPLNIDALFTVAMLELWVLLFYILKYRPKIMTLQMA